MNPLGAIIEGAKQQIKTQGVFMIFSENRGSDKAPRTPSRVIDRPLLRQVSPRDAIWDDRGAERDQVRDLYRGTIFDALAGKIQGCSGHLEFEYLVGPDGLPKHKLKSTWFCRVRYCPVCMWRKQLVWRARAFKAIPNVIAAYPSHRWLALTLTIRNCEMDDLRETTRVMGKAWTRLTHDPRWPAVGWLRSLEVTKGEDGSGHPHYHCLLLVPAGYFSTGYITQKEWEALWQKALKIDYPPNVHVSAVTGKQKGRGKESLPIDKAILESIQYSVKPSELIEDQGWLVKLTAQMKGVRTVATGGILKQFFKELEEEPKDLIHVNDDQEEEGSVIAELYFDWEEKYKRYVLSDDGDYPL